MFTGVCLHILKGFVYTCLQGFKLTHVYRGLFRHVCRVLSLQMFTGVCLLIYMGLYKCVTGVVYMY